MLVLFVCFANTCRSPMAEAVLNHLQSKKQLNWAVDSAGTSDMNAGRSPNPNTFAVLREHGLGSSHVSRQVRVEDFSNFDYILSMDESNLSYLKRIAPEGCRAKVELLGEYRMDELDKIVVDPYVRNRNKALKPIDGATTRSLYAARTLSIKRFKS
ncbi:low molecular weight protein-tyrosine-phosphatase [Culex quinquefasciatus]|uniref:acid phosphatase n=1 Tax=Culex quinquefasciatus TaxID=7176 RepID=B0W218_CULQU|nr:low molecular weight protein-tyrosine-phosphatase [Culex quinquefasciatus]|eukprot:XP_001842752.1 low molecular weight protein-tyrosine-phosphatase [Culex quinquefasciatus]